MNNSIGMEKKVNAGKWGANAMLFFLLQLAFAPLALSADVPSAEQSPVHSTSSLDSSSTATAHPTEIIERAAISQATSPKPSARSEATLAPGYKNPALGAPTPKPDTGAYLLNLVLGLTLIVGLIFALAWLVRRMGQGSLLATSHLKMLAVMPLGTRERLVVVEAGKQQLLLGITATQITTLHTFAEPIIDAADTTSSEFSKKLFAILHKKEPSASSFRTQSSVSTEDHEQR